MLKRINKAANYFLESESASGIFLIMTTVAALLIANSSLSNIYFSSLALHIGPLSIEHWVNDALMSVFFLMVGLEIKREMAEGQLSSWSSRILPGAAAIGGVVVPALIYLAFNSGSEAAHGWAVPTATDIAFSLGVVSLLGTRVPSSLKIFLAALAIIDDLIAVAVIGIFYTENVSIANLGMAALCFLALLGMNRSGVSKVIPYLIVGTILWFFTFKSGVHATIAGVLLALTIPLGKDHSRSALHSLEHALTKPVAFIIVPIFAFANAGISFEGLSLDVLSSPVTMGIALALLFGKVIGVFTVTTVIVKLGFGKTGKGWQQMLGIAFLCGIGFTMSLFIALLGFSDIDIQNEAKIGILTGSFISGLIGYMILRFCSPYQNN